MLIPSISKKKKKERTCYIILKQCQPIIGKKRAFINTCSLVQRFPRKRNEGRSLWPFSTINNISQHLSEAAESCVLFAFPLLPPGSDLSCFFDVDLINHHPSSSKWVQRDYTILWKPFKLLFLTTKAALFKKNLQ